MKTRFFAKNKRTFFLIFFFSGFIISALTVRLMGSMGSGHIIILRLCSLCLFFLSVRQAYLIYKDLVDERNVNREEIHREKLISQLSESLLQASGIDELYTLTLKSIYSVVDCPSAIFVSDGSGGFTRIKSYPEGLLLYPPDEEILHCLKEGIRTGRGTASFKEKALTCYPVKAEEKVLAAVGLLAGPDTILSASRQKTVESLLLRAGVALERFRLAEEQQQAMMEKELEHMRSDFLRTISHDLRTPLTGIIGACSALEQGDLNLTESAKKDLVSDIGAEAQWLLRMVENLLSVTRVGAEKPILNISEQPIEEVLAEVLEKTRTRFPSVQLRIHQPDDFLMVPMDATLIVQVLMNLIDNSVKYAGSDKPIDLSVKDNADTVQFSIKDQGIGLSEKKLRTLFEPSAQRSGDSSHGMGLGLSLCKSIITAHDGTISGENNPEGGAEFTITLPKGSDL
ncbi:MAG: ATP-binding protein [Clostridia bacterium]|nr:ATP-binding protein [Clostridia bacterium]